MREIRTPIRAARTPMRAVRTPPKKEVHTQRSRSKEVKEGSRLNSEDSPAPVSGPKVLWPGYMPRSNRVTPVVEVESSLAFLYDHSGTSPLFLKRMRIDLENDDPDFGKVPTEFILGPLPGPPAPKKRKLLVDTPRKWVCRNPNPPQTGRADQWVGIAPMKWALPLHLPSTSTSPIRKRSTEWDDDDNDDHKSPPIEELTLPAQAPGSGCGCGGYQ